jgi:putative ABC transport system ATP-binding protein
MGQSLESLDEEARAQLRSGAVGFVFQAFELIPSLNALENVMLPLELMRDKDARSKAKAALQEMGLGHRLAHFPTTLSGGEQQRVAIARAFITEPKIVFADEPTGNLDAGTGSQMIDLMFKQKQKGVSLVLVTHDPDLAAHCDRQIHIQGGKIVK